MWPHALRAIIGRTNDFQKSTQMTGQRDIDTDEHRYKRTDGNISSNGLHVGPLVPSVVNNSHYLIE